MLRLLGDSGLCSWRVDLSSLKLQVLTGTKGVGGRSEGYSPQISKCSGPYS